MKPIRIILLVVISQSLLSAQSEDGEVLLKRMHRKYEKASCPIYSFSQKNSHYRNDSLIRNSVWHEVIAFPDKFRIHFGDPAKGNAVLFRNDSAYNFKDGKLLKSRRDTNSLILILGGMYYRGFPDVVLRLREAGYDYHTVSERLWNNKMVYVIGARQGDSLSNQIWVDKNDLRVLRIIEKINAIDQMDMRFEAHQAWCKGFVETKVAFYRNGKLEQVEEYYDLKVLDKFPD